MIALQDRGRMPSTRPRAENSPFIGKAVRVTKDLQSRCFACWLCGLVLLNLRAVPVVSQGNTTDTDSMTTTPSSGTINSSDAMMTSLGVNTTADNTEIQTELVTQLVTEWVNVTMLPEVNQTYQSTESVAENMTTFAEFTNGEIATDPTAENNTLQMTTEEYSNGTSSYESSSLSVNITNGPAQSITPLGQTTGTLPTVFTSDTSNTPVPAIVYSQSFIIPILIFGGLLYLLAIMIFIVIFTKSRVKRSISAYNLTPAANANHSQIGYRNTAYEQGDVADDTDVECSMREMRMEMRSTNGNAVLNFKDLEEELTPL